MQIENILLFLKKQKKSYQKLLKVESNLLVLKNIEENSALPIRGKPLGTKA